MASNNLNDLKNVLFNELMRLDDDDIEPDKLATEITRSEAMAKTGEVIVKIADTQLKASNIKDRFNVFNSTIPSMIGLHENEKKRRI